MMICQLAGFLGSGKTTLMVRLGTELAKAGKKVAIIVNEVGEVGVDGAVIESFGLRSVELTEGCICCSLSGSLQNTLKIIAKEYKPDIILIEPTGLALPSRINTIIRTSMVEVERNVTVVLVDAFRAEKLLNEIARRHRFVEMLCRPPIPNHVAEFHLVSAFLLRNCRSPLLTS